MPNHRIIPIVSHAFLGEHSREFLHIADLPSCEAAEFRIARAQAVAVLRIGHAMADFAQGWLLCRWDRNFYFLGSRIFVRFLLDDLLAAEAPSSADLVEGLRDFDLWQSAWVSLNEGAPERTGKTEEARSCPDEPALTICRFCSEKAPSGEQKHAFFLGWVARHARVAGYEWGAFTLDGIGLAGWMPPKMLLRRRSLASTENVPVPQDCRNVVVGYQRVRLITSAGGRKLLTSARPGDPVPRPQDILRYPVDSARSIKRWIVLNQATVR